MAEGSLWIRLDVGYLYDETGDGVWLDSLPWEVKACWHVFLLYVKAHGNKRGKCPVVQLSAIARLFGCPTESLRKCLDAAEAGGGLVTDKRYWTVTHWEGAQSPDAARKRRERDHWKVTDEPHLSRTESDHVDNRIPKTVTDEGDSSRTNEGCPVSLSRDSFTDNSSNPPTANAVSPFEWWEGHPDQLTGWVGFMLNSVPKFRGCPRPATREGTEDLVERLRRDAPHEEAIRDFVQEFTDFHATDTVAKYGADDPLGKAKERALLKHSLWQTAKRAIQKAQSSPDDDQATPIEGKDYRLVARGDVAVRIDLTTGDPFDLDAWRERRGQASRF